MRRTAIALRRERGLASAADASIHPGAATPTELAGQIAAAAAQDALVADATGDPVGVHGLEKRLRKLAGDAEPVAHLRQRHPPVLRGQRDHGVAGFGERLRREREVAAGAHRPPFGDEIPKRRLVACGEGRRGERRLPQAGGEAPPPRRGGGPGGGGGGGGRAGPPPRRGRGGGGG